MKLQTFFDISQASNLQSLESQLQAFADDLEFPLFTAALVVDGPSAGAKSEFHVLSNMPQAFLETSRDPSLSKRDPVNRNLRELSVPFAYDRALYVREGAEDLWERQAPFGYQAGIAVALHLPARRHFLLGVDRAGALPRSETQLVQLFGQVQLLAVHAQSAAVRLLDPERVEPELRLTPRELEILRWTRDGKSAWDTGVVLGISQATVNFHLRNLCAKFGVASKHQAVLRAIELGWID